MNFKIFLFL